MRQHLPPVDVFIGKQIPSTSWTIQSHLGSGGNARVFVARSGDLVRSVACKIIPVANLIGADQSPPAWKQEIHKANSLASNRVLKFFQMGEWSIEGHQCVFLLSELVVGQSLREFQKMGHVDVGFVELFLIEMLEFMHELAQAGMQHGDFHAGNVLLHRNQSLRGDHYAFRVTDFGVAPGTSSNAELLDDFAELAQMLRDLLALVDYQSCSAEDRYVFDALNDDILAKALLETNPLRDQRARNAEQLFRSVQAIRARYVEVSISKTRRTLITPFDYLSCEQIGEHHALLKELYSDKMLGLPAIEEVNNLVLTGPRGCGKTTVFRSLSLRHQVLTDDDLPSDVCYIGVYYRCDDLYFSFPRYGLPTRTEALDVPLHFVTVTLLGELLASLAMWMPRHFSAEWSKDESTAARELWDLLQLKKPSRPGADSFDSLRRSLDEERKRAAKKQRFANDPSQKFGLYCGPDVLPRACDVLTRLFRPLSERHIYFFVDDYSDPKISRQLQQNLNRLLMQRTSHCFFKLATESPASYESKDVDGKSYVEGREFKLANLGIDFINAESDDKLRFVDDIFDRRFRYAQDYPVKTLQALVGDDEEQASQNEVARAIREKKYPIVWGRRALSELCSGDVHFVIELVGKMVSNVGGKDSLVVPGVGPAIPPYEQNKTIRAEAGKFLRNLRSLPEGKDLVEVVEVFGAVAASFLRHRDSKNEDKNPPHQASRIEPREEPRLSDKAKQVYDDLLRYSVFLEDVRGKSRRGKVVPRLYLRRFLIPFFNLTFSKRDSIELNVDEFMLLLLQPREFEKQKRMRDSQDNEQSVDRANEPKPQLSLFGEEKE